MKVLPSFYAIFAFASILSVASGWSFSSRGSSSSTNQLTDVNQQQCRASFLAKCGAAAAASLVGCHGPNSQIQPAFAKDVDPALKGTKKDPEFEKCLSECMYECTKPKGVEQKSRAECLPECKKECAKNKAQLMIGTPIQK